MKRVYVFYLALFSILVAGCSKYGYVRLNYPQEPQMYLPEGVNNIAVVNRSLTTEEDNKSKIAEAIGTAEIAGSDRQASEQCLTGVFQGLNGYRGVQIIFPEGTHLYGTGTREVPEPLDWDQVEEICNKAGADVLLALENFDSNSDLLLAAAVEQVTSLVITGHPTDPVPNQVRMNVYSYWRMYDPLTRKIIDQYQHTNYMTFNMQGAVPPLNALPETAYEAGRAFSARYLPGYYTVKRDLYKKGKGKSKKRFEAAFRRTEVANWQEAIEIWEELVDKVKRKTAGRACLNIAVAYEVLGNTDQALEWAQRSYMDYRDKLGKDYAKVLLRRKSLEY
jgi:tetratricopeptide (TPR) repeat protein